MALLPDYFDELGAICERTPTAMDHMCRTLRAGGALPSSKRGNGATPVDPTMLANLLIASMMTGSLTTAPRQVEVFRSLKPRRKGGFGKPFPSLRNVAKCETFGQALEDLLLLSNRLRNEALTLLELLYDTMPPEQLLSLEFFQVKLTLQQRPAPFARLTLEALNQVGVYTHLFSQEWTVDSGLFMSGFYRPEMQASPDVCVQTTIGHRVLFRLGDLLRSPDEEEDHDNADSRTAGEASPEGGRDAGASRQGRGRGTRSHGYRESGLRLPES